MAASGILITVDATTAQFDRAMSAADKTLLRYSSQLKLAQKAQAEFDAAVAASGASSAEAAAAQNKLGAALARTTVAEQRAGIAAKQAAEIQAAASAKAAAAAESQAVAQAAALRKVGTVAGSIGAAAALGLGLAAKAASDFNAKMAQVQSLTRANATDMAELTAATHGFADIGVSASDAADAEIELVKAGVSVKDIMGGGLQGALQLAAAGQTDVATATEIASAAMVQFGLAGKDITHIADLLAAGADKSLGSVTDLGFGLKAVGTTAHQAGLSVEETVGTLAEFASAGLTAELGGTAFKQMLLKLEAPSSAAGLQMKELGLHLYDANGHMVTMTNLAGQLHDKLGELDDATRNQALATIFGARAVQAANVLFQQGAKGTADWTKKVDQAGFAAEQTAGKMDSLQGDVQKLGATFQNDLIDAGQRLQPILRAITQDLTALGGEVGDLPGPVKDFAANMTAAVAAVGLGVFAFTRIKTALAGLGTTMGVTGKGALAMRGGFLAAGVALETFSASLDNTHDSAKAFLNIAGGAAMGAAFGPWGAVVGGAAGALQTFAARSQEAAAAQAQLNGIAATVIGTLNQQTGVVTAATVAMTQKQLIDKGGVQAAQALGLSFSTLTDAALGNKGAMNDVTEATKGFIAENGGGVDAVGALVKSLGGVLPLIDTLAAQYDAAQKHIRQFAIAQGQAQNAIVGVRDAARHMGGAFLEFGALAPKVADDSKNVGNAAETAAAQIDGLARSQRHLDAAFAASIGSVAALTLEIQASKEATKGLSGVMNHNRTAINLQSVAGATLIQNMTGIADAALKVKGSQDRQAAAVQNARHAIIAQSEAAGASAEVARNLADKLLTVANNANKIPPSKSVHVAAPGLSNVDYMLDRALQSLNAFHSVNFNVNTNFTHTGTQFQPYADGGIHEQHMAQIPTPGMTRVWNEPEAGGEAYIPFAPQKRPRSRAIATETVARLGGSVSWHASGAMYGQAQQWQGVNSTRTVVVQAPRGSQKITLDIGGGKVLTGVIREVARDEIHQDSVHQQTLAGIR